MTRTAFRKWLWLHKWTSLICTIFLLVLCITGLPLVFRDEIGNWLENSPAYANVPAGTPLVSMDHVAAEARAMYPGQIVASIFIDDDEPKIVVTMAPSWAAYKSDRSSWKWVAFDAHTGKLLKRSGGDSGLLNWIFDLHKNLFAGLAGELFLALMAVFFVVAIVSGVVIYGPFVRRLDFGTVRAGRSPRLKWLDLHNLLGVVLLAWMAVVGLTGLLNELSTPLFGIWQATEVKAFLAPFHGRATPAESELSSPQKAFDKVRDALPDMVATSVIFPGSPFGTPYHYLVWTKGRQPLTSRLFSPVLIDARSGTLASIVRMPWYLRALEVSRPLHFGDYGGLPLKIIWALFDIGTIAVLSSGLYLWLSRRPSRDEVEDEIKGSLDSLTPLSPEAAE